MSFRNPTPGPFGDKPMGVLSPETILSHTELITREDNFPSGKSGDRQDSSRAVLEFAGDLGSLTLQTFHLLKELDSSDQLPHDWVEAASGSLYGYAQRQALDGQSLGLQPNSTNSHGIFLDRDSTTVCLWQRQSGPDGQFTRKIHLPTEPLLGQLRSQSPREWVCGAVRLTYDDGSHILREISPFLLPGFTAPGENPHNTGLTMYAVQARMSAQAVIPATIASMQQP